MSADSVELRELPTFQPRWDAIRSRSRRQAATPRSSSTGCSGSRRPASGSRTPSAARASCPCVCRRCWTASPATLRTRSARPSRPTSTRGSPAFHRDDHARALAARRRHSHALGADPGVGDPGGCREPARGAAGASRLDLRALRPSGTPPHPRDRREAAAWPGGCARARQSRGRRRWGEPRGGRSASSRGRALPRRAGAPDSDGAGRGADGAGPGAGSSAGDTSQGAWHRDGPGARRAGNGRLALSGPCHFSGPAAATLPATPGPQAQAAAEAAAALGQKLLLVPGIGALLPADAPEAADELRFASLSCSSGCRRARRSPSSAPRPRRPSSGGMRRNTAKALPAPAPRRESLPERPRPHHEFEAIAASKLLFLPGRWLIASSRRLNARAAHRPPSVGSNSSGIGRAGAAMALSEGAVGPAEDAKGSLPCPVTGTTRPLRHRLRDLVAPPGPFRPRARRSFGNWSRTPGCPPGTGRAHAPVIPQSAFGIWSLPVEGSGSGRGRFGNWSRPYKGGKSNNAKTKIQASGRSWAARPDPEWTATSATA